jgi:hypothetical protein
MSNQMPDFPQDELPEDEISRKEAPVRRPRRPRGKSILGKFLFILVIAAIMLAGFLYIQQSLLDLEAQAQVFAVQTAAARSSVGTLAEVPASSTLASFPTSESSPAAATASTPDASATIAPQSTATTG